MYQLPWRGETLRHQRQGKGYRRGIFCGEAVQQALDLGERLAVELLHLGGQGRSKCRDRIRHAQGRVYLDEVIQGRAGTDELTERVSRQLDPVIGRQYSVEAFDHLDLESGGKRRQFARVVL